jgi:hypothetical protein
MKQETTVAQAAKKPATKKGPSNGALLRSCIARKAKKDGITAVKLDVSDDILIVLYVSPHPHPRPGKAKYADFKAEFDSLGKQICSCLKTYPLRGVKSFEMEAYASKKAMETGGGGEPLMADPTGGGSGSGNTCKDARFKPKPRKG